MNFKNKTSNRIMVLLILAVIMLNGILPSISNVSYADDSDASRKLKKEMFNAVKSDLRRDGEAQEVIDAYGAIVVVLPADKAKTNGIEMKDPTVKQDSVIMVDGKEISPEFTLKTPNGQYTATVDTVKQRNGEIIIQFNVGEVNGEEYPIWPDFILAAPDNSDDSPNQGNKEEQDNNGEQDNQDNQNNQENQDNQNTQDNSDESDIDDSDYELEVVDEGDEGDDANLLERAISYFILVVAQGTLALIRMIVGSENFSIEAVIFNQYPNTSLSIFSNSNVVNNPLLDDGLKASLTDVYSFFRSIAIVAYMIIVAYMGVRILLSSTARQGAKHKELLTYLVQGIMILFLFPYVIRYTIDVNNAFVAYIYKNKNEEMALGSNYNVSISGGNENLGGLEEASKAVENQLLEGQDYMSKMFQIAWSRGWLVHAICCAVMVKQLLGFIIIYFKRLLTILFLIAIFPLVSISYAIDKIGDGKSQAFNNWYKEFALNVFLQSFHAVVYVVGMALITQIGSTVRIERCWLIIILILEFIAKGDEFLRNIFNVKGGGGDTVKGLATSVIQANAALKFANTARSSVTKRFSSGSNFAKARDKAANVLDNVSNIRYQRSQVRVDNAQSDVIDSQLAAAGYQEDAAPLSLRESADVLFNANATDDEKLMALDNILDGMNGSASEEELQDMANYISAKYGEDAAKELDKMLKIRAAANAVVGGKITNIQLNQNIQILLDAYKVGGIAGAIASGVATPEQLKQLQLMSNVKFSKPPRRVTPQGRRVKQGGGEAARQKARRNGDKYAGTFTPAQEQMAQSRERVSASGSARAQGSSDVRKFQRYAKQDAKKMRSLQKQLKHLESQGKVGTPKYNEIVDTMNRMGGTSARSVRRSVAIGAGSFAIKRYGKQQRYVGTNGASNGKNTARGGRAKPVERVKTSSQPDYSTPATYTTQGANAKAGKRQKMMMDQANMYEKLGRHEDAVEMRAKLEGTSGARTKNPFARKAGGTKKVSNQRAGSKVTIGGKPVSVQVMKGRPGGGSNEKATTRIAIGVKDTGTSTVGRTSRETFKPVTFVSVNDTDTKIEVIKKVKSAISQVADKKQETSVMASALNEKKRIEQFANSQGISQSLGTGMPKLQPIGSKVKLNPDIVNSASRENVRAMMMEGATIISGRHTSSQSSAPTQKKAKIDVKYSDQMLEEAKKYVSDNVLKDKTAKGEKLMTLAASVVAINMVSEGKEQLSASQTLGHIDNIRQVKADLNKELKNLNARKTVGLTPQEKDKIDGKIAKVKAYIAEADKTLGKLEYNLDDFEANLRVQVLNDTSLIDSNDPNRAAIINTSIKYVQEKLSDDNLFLSELRYNRDDLKVGIEPVAGYGDVDDTSRIAESGMMTLTDEEKKQRELLDKKVALESSMEQKRQIIQKESGKIVGNVGGALAGVASGVLDVGASVVSAGLGVVAGGIGSSGKKEDFILSTAKNTVTGYSLGETGYTRTKNSFLVNQTVAAGRNIGGRIADSRPGQSVRSKVSEAFNNAVYNGKRMNSMSGDDFVENKRVQAARRSSTGGVSFEDLAKKDSNGTNN